jgi:hypothetical protein
MYPHEFFGLYPPFPLKDEAFVAMSFGVHFDSRWTSVLKPALENSHILGRSLTAHRVDISRAGGSILTEILARIGQATVIVADITAVLEQDGRALRNANVFYEVGLAHATRLPEEVLLFRSDNLPLAFDVANVRVHTYAPDTDPVNAQAFVSDTVRDSLRELHLRRTYAIERAVGALDAESFQTLGEAIGGSLHTPKLNTMGDILGGLPRLASLRRLLDIGALQAEFKRVTIESVATYMEAPRESMITFRVTPLGYELYARALEVSGALEPAINAAMRKHITDNNPSAASVSPAV